MSRNSLTSSNFDFTREQDRFLLFETLERLAQAQRESGVEIETIKNSSNQIVRAQPLRHFPVAMGEVYKGVAAGTSDAAVGDFRWSASNPGTGWLLCDGSEVSRTTFSDLFAVLGTAFGAGNGSTTFNLPDPRGRSPMARGQGAGLTNRALGQALGSENEVAPLPSHSHKMAHTHLHEHFHKMAHTHQLPGPGTGVGAGGGQGTLVGDFNTFTYEANPDTDQPNTQVTSNLTDTGFGQTPETSQPNTDQTSNTGSGGTHNNVGPAIVLGDLYVRAVPSSASGGASVQHMPIAWGPVNAEWQLDTPSGLPNASFANLAGSIAGQLAREAFVRVSFLGGTQAGDTTQCVVRGVIALPDNFTGWNPDGIKLRWRVDSTGIDNAEELNVQLRVNNPTAAGFLAATYDATIGEVGGAILASNFVTAQLTAEQLGADWKAGYMLRFEFEWTHPRKFATANLYLGRLELDMR